MAIATALDLIQDRLMGVKVRVTEPVAESPNPLLPGHQNMVDYPGGRLFATTDLENNFSDDISIYPFWGSRYSCQVQHGKIVYISHSVEEYVEEEGQDLPFEVWGWPVSHEGTTIRSKAGQLPDEVANGLYAIGLLAL